MQKEDLARMYRLFQRIPKGLDPVADVFRRHVESEGMALVKAVTEAAEAKKDKDAGAHLWHFDPQVTASSSRKRSELGTEPVCYTSVLPAIFPTLACFLEMAEPRVPI